MAKSWVLLVGAAVALMSARPADAYPTDDGSGTVGVVYPFRGTVTVLSTSEELGCCTLGLAQGDTVTGSLSLSSVFAIPNQRMANARWQVAGQDVFVGGLFPLLVDGSGAADEFSAA